MSGPIPEAYVVEFRAAVAREVEHLLGDQLRCATEDGFRLGMKSAADMLEQFPDQVAHRLPPEFMDQFRVIVTGICSTFRTVGAEFKIGGSQ